MTDDAILSVRDLEKHYPVRSGILRRVTGHVKAVDGVSFEVREGETVGLVGESGCGKSTTATSLLRLEEPTGGEVYFEGEDITEYGDDDETEFRRRAQMVFQDPNSAFDPRMTVGESVAEPLGIHGLRDEERQQEIVADLLERVGLSANDADRYPHEFSGGQKQRIALARALILNPDLLVADEPVSALDVSVQAEILSLLDDLQAELDLSMLLISHDLGVVRQVCDRVGVMYLGEMVEMGPTEELFENPQHPYTEALLASIPDPDPRKRGDAVELTGDVPDPSNPPAGCSFHRAARTSSRRRRTTSRRARSGRCWTSGWPPRTVTWTPRPWTTGQTSGPSSTSRGRSRTPTRRQCSRRLSTTRWPATWTPRPTDSAKRSRRSASSGNPNYRRPAPATPRPATSTTPARRTRPRG